MKTFLSKYCLLLFLALMPALTSCADKNEALETSVEFRAAPEGIAMENPRFSWILNADGRGIMQKS